jgi:molybdenum-dependent DNA-binding transcriptional regulator ModE
MVIVVSRHGVRSPTHPDLTDRGAVLMRLRRALEMNVERVLTRDRTRVIVAAMSLRAMRMMFSMGCMHKHAAGSS